MLDMYTKRQYGPEIKALAHVTIVMAVSLLYVCVSRVCLDMCIKPQHGPRLMALAHLTIAMTVSLLYVWESKV